MIEFIQIVVDEHERPGVITSDNAPLSSTQADSAPANQVESELLQKNQVESELLQKMKRAYVDYFDNQFEPELPKDNKNKPIYPQFTEIIDDDVYEVVFDSELFEQLCDIYIIEGWSGISAIQTTVNEVSKDNSKELSGGVQDRKWRIDVHPKQVNAWNLARDFFDFTQKMLALLIRETLVNIEKLSATRIIAKLSISNIEIAKAWIKYDIKENEVDEFDENGQPAGKSVYYSLRNKANSNELMKDLSVLVKEKYKYDRIIRELELINKRIENVESAVFDGINLTYKSDKEDKNKLITLKSASESLIKTLKSFLEKKHPFGLLIFPSLNEEFDQSKMENLFGLTIDNLRKDLESIGSQINPQVSIIEQLVYFNQSENIIQDIKSFNLTLNSIEQDVIEKSLANYKNVEFLPMLAEDNINQLFSQEIINQDSFEYVVGFHYLSGLIKKLEEIKKEESIWEDFWKKIGKISSALSLASLMTPATAEAAPFLRGAAAIADIALVAYTIDTITGSLKRNNELITKTLINQDDFSTQSFAQLGEVISLRKEFYDSLTEQIAIEIINIYLLGNLPVFKEILLARNYYYDFETLIETEEEV